MEGRESWHCPQHIKLVSFPDYSKLFFMASGQQLDLYVCSLGSPATEEVMVLHATSVHNSPAWRPRSADQHVWMNVEVRRADIRLYVFVFCAFCPDGSDSSGSKVWPMYAQGQAHIRWTCAWAKHRAEWDGVLHSFWLGYLLSEHSRSMYCGRLS